MRACLWLLLAAAPLAGEGDYPDLPLKPFFARAGKRGFRPALPADLRLMDQKAAGVLAFFRGERAYYVETEYVRLISCVPPLKVNLETAPRIRESLRALARVYPRLKRRFPVLGRKELAHFFVYHLHRVMGECWRLFGTTRRTYEDYLRRYNYGPYMRQKNKFEVYLFARKADYLRFADRFVGRRSDDGQRWRNPVTDALALLLPPPPGGGKDLNNWVHAIVHNWVHLLIMSEVKNSYNLPPWLDVGFAHFMERREGPGPDTYCFDEGSRPPRFTADPWRPAVRRLVVSGRAPRFLDFFGKQNLGQLHGREHGMAFALVDYMLREHRRGFQQFLRLRFRHQDQSQQEAFRQAFRMGPNRFEEAFRAWVREHYTPEGLKGLRRQPVP